MPTTTTTITEAEYLDHCESHDGLCLACGEFGCGGVEPDAEGYLCEVCDAREVVGTEQALLMGRIEFSEVA